MNLGLAEEVREGHDDTVTEERETERGGGWGAGRGAHREGHTERGA